MAPADEIAVFAVDDALGNAVQKKELLRAAAAGDRVQRPAREGFRDGIFALQPHVLPFAAPGVARGDGLKARFGHAPEMFPGEVRLRIFKRADLLIDQLFVDPQRRVQLVQHPLVQVFVIHGPTSCFFS